MDRRAAGGPGRASEALPSLPLNRCAKGDQAVHGRHDRALDVLSDLLATPAPDRERRIAKLAKPMLVRLLAIAIRDSEREKTELKDEVDCVSRRLKAVETPGAKEQ
ncbi:MAG: hypothetical protein AB1714_13190 [Acidobacteriota bacterium]